MFVVSRKAGVMGFWCGGTAVSSKFRIDRGCIVQLEQVDRREC